MAAAIIGTPPTPMPTFGCTGISASAMHGLISVQARAVFQATVFVVFTLTAGPKTVAPAACTTCIWSCGHMPASRLPS